MGWGFDPRFLIFEFTTSVVLRQPQVQLVERFVATLAGGASLVAQLIMGAGKTTTIAPLLALILADGAQLVMQVVPPALLTFSRSVLRERFSSFVSKPVYTFHFERALDVSPAGFPDDTSTRGWRRQ